MKTGATSRFNLHVDVASFLNKNICAFMIVFLNSKLQGGALGRVSVVVDWSTDCHQKPGCHAREVAVKKYQDL